MATRGDAFLKQVRVRPILREERGRWQALMREHHYLGFNGAVGERVELAGAITSTDLIKKLLPFRPLHLGLQKPAIVDFELFFDLLGQRFADGALSTLDL